METHDRQISRRLAAPAHDRENFAVSLRRDPAAIQSEAAVADRDILWFLGESQKSWLSLFPQMTRRAQPHLAMFLCVNQRGGCQFAELSGFIRQNFLLDEATIKERIRMAIGESLVCIEPEILSSRTIIMPTAQLHALYDQFLTAIALLLRRMPGARRGLLQPGAAISPDQRAALAACTDCHVPVFAAAVDRICQERGLSRARSLEARRSLLSMSHWTMLRLVLEMALLPRGTPPDILADDLAASLVGLTRQNFQTTRDHINYLISVGIFERRGGKTLHVGLANAAVGHFRTALAQTGAALAGLAGAVMAGRPDQDLTTEIVTGCCTDTWLRPAAGETLQHRLTIMGPDGAVWRAVLTAGPNTIGRMAPCDIVLPGHSVSRAHCRIDIAGTVATLTDLDSTNGTRLDGDVLRMTQPLVSGARLGVGDYALLYAATSGPDAA